MANGDNDPLSGLPWWVKAIVIVGVPSAIALGLVWSDRMQLTTTVRDNQDRLIRIETVQSTHDSRVWTRFDELAAASRETNRILLATCVNQAATAADRERCVGWK